MWMTFLILTFCKNQKKRLFFLKDKKEERFKDKYLAPVVTKSWYESYKITEKKAYFHYQKVVI